MRKLISKFTFFKAGQGAFYGGRISLSDKVFTIVYDCGTSSFVAGNNQSLNNEIEYYKEDKDFPQCCKKIELLFISHLDYDHVSGLKKLLTEFRVKNIILPYIEIRHRQFFLTSISDNDENENNLTIDEYISFIENPSQFITENSGDTTQFYIKPNNENDIENIRYSNNNNQQENLYPIGTIDTNVSELDSSPNTFLYENNLQFFIKQAWEFTTFVKSVNQDAIDNLHACLKKELKKNVNDDLSFKDLEQIVKKHRKEAHKCYSKFIGNINSHGLVLLHGPLPFNKNEKNNSTNLNVDINCNCEMNSFTKNNCCQQKYDVQQNYTENSKLIFGTLLLGDTSLNPCNNPLDFPKEFKDKLVNVYVVQVPHHGSSKNWNFEKFNELHCNKKNVIAVCNFGYGNPYGHPSKQIIKDLETNLFLNSQFSRLNICYYNTTHFPIRK